MNETKEQDKFEQFCDYHTGFEVVNGKLQRAQRVLRFGNSFGIVKMTVSKVAPLLYRPFE